MNEIIDILSLISLCIALIQFHMVLTDQFKLMWFVYTFAPYTIILDVIIVLFSIINSDMQKAIIFIMIAYMKYSQYIKIKNEVER